MTPQEEELKAKELVDYYKICFAHPAVEGILMWGFWAGANWIPVSSLYNRDWSPTPAAEAYYNLIFKSGGPGNRGQLVKMGLILFLLSMENTKLLLMGFQERLILAKKKVMFMLNLKDK